MVDGDLDTPGTKVPGCGLFPRGALRPFPYVSIIIIFYAENYGIKKRNLF